jgi:hypothetical protein
VLGILLYSKDILSIKIIWFIKKLNSIILSFSLLEYYFNFNVMIWKFWLKFKSISLLNAMKMYKTLLLNGYEEWFCENFNQIKIFYGKNWMLVSNLIFKKHEINKFESLLSFVRNWHSEWDKANCLTVRLLLAIWANCWHYSVCQTIVI